METIRMGFLHLAALLWAYRGLGRRHWRGNELDSDLSLAKCSISFAPVSHLVPKLLFLTLEFEAYCFWLQLSVVATGSGACAGPQCYPQNSASQGTSDW